MEQSVEASMPASAGAAASTVPADGRVPPFPALQLLDAMKSGLEVLSWHTIRLPILVADQVDQIQLDVASGSPTVRS